MNFFSFRRLAVFALLLCSVVSMAHDFEYNGIYYKFVSVADYTIAVTYKGNSYDEYSGEYSGVVTIPAAIDYYGTTYKVVSVGGNAFRNCAGLASVTIGNSVTSIGIYAFEGCTGLASVTIGANVGSFGGGEFWGCTALTSIKVVSENPYFDSRDNCNAIIGTGTNALYVGCRNTKIPASVTSIIDYAFYQCAGLTSIAIPNSVTSIGYYAFSGCTGLKEVHISDLAAWCKIDFANDESNPLDYALNLYLNGEKVTNFVIPDGVTKIKKYAFIGCKNLTSITIPNSVTSIGAWAFIGCSGLTGELIIPNSVASIGEDAFYNCSGLTGITIPNSVTTIGNSAFYGCANLKNVVNLSSLSIEKGSIGNGYVAYYADKVINAPNGSVEGDYVFGVVDGVNTLCGYIGNGGEITLPADYKGENYVIGADVFKNNTALIGVTIGNSVTSIESGAFSGCSGLTCVTIGNSVTSIGDYAFAYCTGLTSITIPNSVKSIGNSAFNNCSGLTGITIPNSVTSIGNYAFSGCSGLTSITIPNSITSIGNYAFYYCRGLTSITIPNSVTSIGNSAFNNCTGLKTVYNLSELTLRSGSTDNGYVAYYADKVINAPNGSVEGDYVFSVVDGANTLCGYIGNGGEITLPADYKGENYVIGADVFKNNTALIGVTIPNSVTSIGSGAFEGCTGLKTVYNLSELTLRSGSADNGYVAYYADKVINAPNGSIEGDYVFRIVDGVSTLCGYIGNGGEITLPTDYKGENYVIGADVFKNNTALTSVTIPNSVTSIGSGAFEGCTGLISITIPNSVTTIGNSAFYGCANLKNVVNLSSLSIEKGSTGNGYVAYYADKVINIKDDFEDVLDCYIFCKKNGELALTGCREHNDSTLYLPRDYYGSKYVVADSAFVTIRGSKWYLDIPNSVTAIGDYAFYGCVSSISARPWELVIPASVASIGDYAFVSCSAIGKLEIPATVKSIGDGAFKRCARITDVTILAEIPAIKNEMFYGCRSLKNIAIPASVTSIGDKAFYNCDSLAGIAIPNSVTIIGYGAFAGCNGLANLEIPNNVTSVGRSAFENCTGLTNVKIGSSVTSIGDRTFYCNTNLQSINIPAGVTYVGNLAFQYCDLRSIHIPASLVEIGDYAFTWNLNLSSITVDKNNPVYYVPDGYKNIIMERATNKIVFACKGAVIPETATAIGNGAFNGVGGIESITIPAGITSIGDWAFDGCRDLKVIYALSETPVELPYNVFSNDAKSAITLYVPIGAKEAYATAWGFDNIVETDFTGVDGVTADEQTGGNELYYDLSGRAVKNPANGIYIYKGKKVLVE